MEIVLRTSTPDGVDVVLPAVVYAKILEEHASVADLELIGKTVKEPDGRRPDPRPGRQRFFRYERALWVLVVVALDADPAIIVTAFAARHPPT